MGLELQSLSQVAPLEVMHQTQTAATVQAAVVVVVVQEARMNQHCRNCILQCCCHRVVVVVVVLVLVLAPTVGAQTAVDCHQLAQDLVSLEVHQQQQQKDVGLQWTSDCAQS